MRLFGAIEGGRRNREVVQIVEIVAFGLFFRWTKAVLCAKG
jgi:hypothetical protein